LTILAREGDDVTFVGNITEGDGEINPAPRAMNVGHCAAGKILPRHLQGAAGASHECQQICIWPLLPGLFQRLAGIGANGIGAYFLRDGCRLESKKHQGNSENVSNGWHERKFELRILKFRFLDKMTK
jgi:hypothetical protein